MGSAPGLRPGAGGVGGRHGSRAGRRRLGGGRPGFRPHLTLYVSGGWGCGGLGVPGRIGRGGSAAGRADGSGCRGRGTSGWSEGMSGCWSAIRRTASVGLSGGSWSGRPAGWTAAASGAWCRPTAGYGAPFACSLATAAVGPPVPVTPPSCPAAGPETTPATGGPPGPDLLRHVLRRQLTHGPQRREEHRQQRERRAGHRHPQRRSQPDRGAQDPAEQGADRDRAPHREPDRRVHPSSSRSGHSSCRNDTWVML